MRSVMSKKMGREQLPAKKSLSAQTVDQNPYSRATARTAG